MPFPNTEFRLPKIVSVKPFVTVQNGVMRYQTAIGNEKKKMFCISKHFPPQNCLQNTTLGFELDPCQD